MPAENPSLQEMLHEYLDMLGFAAMSNDVLGETDKTRLLRYARVIIKALEREHYPQVREVYSRFAMLGLV